MGVKLDTGGWWKKKPLIYTLHHILLGWSYQWDGHVAHMGDVKCIQYFS